MNLRARSLETHGGKSPLNAGELKKMAAAAWHSFGIAVIKPEEIINSFDRQAVINAADKLYGERNP
jgi:hypothetical protein